MQRQTRKYVTQAPLHSNEHKEGTPYSFTKDNGKMRISIAPIKTTDTNSREYFVPAKTQY